MFDMFSLGDFGKQLLGKMPHPVVYFGYTLKDKEQKIQVDAFKVLNPEKFYKIFENQTNFKYKHSKSNIIEYYEKNPQNWHHQIIEKDRFKWIKYLFLLKEKKSMDFYLRMYNSPVDRIHKKNNFYFVLFCHLILLNTEEKQGEVSCSSVLVIEDLTSFFLFTLSLRNSPIGFFL
ncbi:MAG: hypothetical protein ACK4UJ_10850 [Leptonema sp. (in: bacteria)]